ncbi:MAG: flavodoxin domain-containing protein [Acidimicrobiales bacterium]
MSVIVGFATDHGSTEGVARRIGTRLDERGVEGVTVAPMTPDVDVTCFDAAVLGSAIHSGSWLSEGRKLMDRSTDALAERPTWLFSVGSIGETSSFFPDRVGAFFARHRSGPKEIAPWKDAVQLIDHRYFAGAIEADHWPAFGNVVLRILGGRHGDHRDWNDIDAWADSIADHLIDAARKR